MNDKMDKRGFTSGEAMNEYMITRWNERVRTNDEVVILGDFSIGKGAETNEILKRLNGRLCLIEGNHDKFLNHRDFDRNRFVWIKPYDEMQDNRRKVILSHYPVMCYNGQYRIDEHGQPKVYMLYGHVHDTQDERLINRFQQMTRETLVTDYRGETRAIPCHMINCFCRFSDYTPLTLDEWILVDEARRRKMAEETFREIAVSEDGEETDTDSGADREVTV